MYADTYILYSAKFSAKSLGTFTDYCKHVTYLLRGPCPLLRQAATPCHASATLAPPHTHSEIRNTHNLSLSSFRSSTASRDPDTRAPGLLTTNCKGPAGVPALDQVHAPCCQLQATRRLSFQGSQALAIVRAKIHKAGIKTTRSKRPVGVPAIGQQHTLCSQLATRCLSLLRACKRLLFSEQKIKV
jgi:hypothetical protein